VCFGVLTPNQPPQFVSPLHQRYKSFQTYKVDGKFRVSVPPHWRPCAGEPLLLQISSNHGMPMIKVLSQEAYDDRVRLVLESDKTPREKQEILGRLAMHVKETALNDQGKLLIPKELSTYAAIAPDTEIRLAGRGMHFEIWNKENHQRLIEIELNPPGDEEDDLGIF